MKLLLDTNILIALEPTRPSDVEPTSAAGADFIRYANEQGHGLYIHPLARKELGGDRDPERAAARQLLLSKYPELPNPPKLSSELNQELGPTEKYSNDWVDHHLVQALISNAVDWLVTEDTPLRKKIRRLGHGNRVLTVAEAAQLLADLSDQIVQPPPAVQAVAAHVIRDKDPILESFRDNYPKFDEWLTRCKRQHRPAWIIGDPEAGLHAFTIVKTDETESPPELAGRIMKICSFKVAEEANGFRYGELLLKAIFDYAAQNSYDGLFVTVFEKYDRLIDLLQLFGFQLSQASTDLGEWILIKQLKPETDSQNLSPLELHIRFGPRFFETEVPWYLVPIQPRYSSILFPETTEQDSLFPGKHPFGNAIRKAYLCNSQIREISEGAVLAFYRSQQQRGLVSIGIVEETLVSSDPDEIARAVGKRTVYSLSEIQKLCEKSPVLTILFRRAFVLDPYIERRSLERHDVFHKPPQSIVRIRPGGLRWLKQKLIT